MRSCTATTLVVAALLVTPLGGFPARARDVDLTGIAIPVVLEGRYVALPDLRDTLIITRVSRDGYRVVAKKWEGLGFFDGFNYRGVFRLVPDSAGSNPVTGTHVGDRGPRGLVKIHGQYASGRSGEFEAEWSPTAAKPKVGIGSAVVQPPRPLKTIEPKYPQAARDSRIDGTVIVEVLIGEDGRVHETWVIKSIPQLDDAGVEAVQNCPFEPAMPRGKPIAVWVKIPVKFVLP
jgi:protein TonB